MNFEKCKEEISNVFNKLGFKNCDDLTLEVLAEKSNDWPSVNTKEDVINWYQALVENNNVVIENIRIDECKGWYFDDASGYLRHESGDFFYVQGVRVKGTDSREVDSGWDQPILTQVGFSGGILGVIRKKINGIPHYLVDGKFEPGNPDVIQISPTIQATFANIRQKHGGRKPMFSELFIEPEKMGYRVLRKQWLSEDGGRLYLKRNLGMIIEPIDMEVELTGLSGRYRWLTLYQISELLKENSWVSPHIRSLITLL